MLHAPRQTGKTTLPAWTRRPWTLAAGRDDAAAFTYGVLRAALEKEGQSIGPNDMLIAAIALANGLAVVTHNTAEFSRVPGLVLDGWET